MFNDPLFIIVLVAMAAVVLILARGLSYFGKGGADAAKKSNKMMRWRIYAQFAAVVLVVLFVWIRGGV